MSKKLIILILVFLFILVSVFLLFFHINQTPQKDDKVFVPIEKKIENKKSVQEQTDDLIAQGDFAKCGELEDEMFKKVCINNIALNLAKENKDVSYCQKLDNELIQISTCELEVIDMKVLESEDIALCQEYKKHSEQELCKDNFWLEKALAKNNVKECQKNSSKQAREDCESNFFVRKFADSPENFYCGQIKAANFGEDCRLLQSTIQTENKTFDCNALSTDVFRDYCHLQNYQRQFLR